MKKSTAGVLLTAFAATVGGLAYAFGGSGSRKTRLRYMLPILSVQNAQADADVLTPFLRERDILVFPPSEYPVAVNVKNRVPRLRLGTGGTTITTLLPGIQLLPEGVNYVTYNYEADFCPEFTSAYAPSIQFFHQLYVEAHKYGKGLCITPVLAQTDGTWNWQDIAKVSDVIVLQLQNLQTGTRAPAHLQGPALGTNLIAAAEGVAIRVKAGNVNCKVYIQMDVMVNGTPSSLVGDVFAIAKNCPHVDGVTLWYNPGIDGGTSRLPELVKVLQALK